MNRQSKKKKLIWYLLVGMNVVLFLLLGVQYTKKIRIQQGIAEKVLRFHVLANSDSKEDQRLKLAVRDAVGAKMAELLSDVDTRESCEKVVEKEIKTIEAEAETVIAKAGYDYPVEVFIDDVDFPVKTYGSYTFPAGSYRALEVVIGEGEGRNWWCVMYPNMCFSGSVYEVVDENAEEELREVLSEEEYEQVLTSGNYKVQFKYLSFLNK